MIKIVTNAILMVLDPRFPYFTAKKGICRSKIDVLKSQFFKGNHVLKLRAIDFSGEKTGVYVIFSFKILKPKN